MSIIPHAIKPGDLIAITAPSSPPIEEKLTIGIKLLEDLGFQVLLGKSLFERRGFLAGEDKSRAAELMEFFNNPEVKAIFCSRGGTGSLRILPHIDFRSLRGKNKVFMGYSDITVLQLSFYTILDWVSFYGPMVAVDLLQMTNKAFPENSNWYSLISGKGYINKIVRGKPFISGKAEGKLLGGCLTLIQAMAGTAYFPKDQNIVLFWEDVGEAPYRLDRMLNHLRLTGLFERITAVLVGKMKNCDSSSKEPTLSISDILKDNFADYNIPIITELPFGHGNGQLVMPIGVQVHVDGERGEIHFIENAVLNV